MMLSSKPIGPHDVNTDDYAINTPRFRVQLHVRHDILSGDAVHHLCNYDHSV